MKELTHVTLPTIHLKGTSAANLESDYRAVREAVTATEKLLQAATCNLRDFYPQEPDAWQRFQDERAEAFRLLCRAANIQPVRVQVPERAHNLLREIVNTARRAGPGPRGDVAPVLGPRFVGGGLEVREVGTTRATGPEQGTRQAGHLRQVHLARLSGEFRLFRRAQTLPEREHLALAGLAELVEEGGGRGGGHQGPLSKRKTTSPGRP